MDWNDIWLSLLIGGVPMVCISVAGLVITLVFLLVFGLIGRSIYRRSQQAKAVRQASQNWVATTGKVIKSRVEVTGGDEASVDPRVIYEYTVAGQQYQGGQIRAGDQFWYVRSSQEAYEIVDRYPEGAMVTVYYDPDNPGESSLER